MKIQFKLIALPLKLHRFLFIAISTLILLVLSDYLFAQSYDERISIIESEIETINSNAFIGTVLSNSLRVLNEASSSSDAITRLPEGSSIHIIGFEDRYIKILFNGNKEGFVPRVLLERASQNTEIFQAHDYILELFKEMEDLKTQKLETEREILQSRRNQEQIERNSENQRRAKIQNKINRIEDDKRWVKIESAIVKEEPNTNANVIDHLGKWSEIFVQAINEDWFEIMYLNSSFDINSLDDINQINEVYKSGWIHINFVTMTPPTALDLQNRDAKVRRLEFVKNHPTIEGQFKNDILEGNIRIGMSREMAEASWGRPRDINRTVTANIVHEQWVYGSISNRRYLYFRNGILDAFQD